jgi:hypothetical protein
VVLGQVREFLDTAQRPAAMEEKCLWNFLSYACLFFLKDGRLWRRQVTGYHQLVIDSEKRVKIDLYRVEGVC